MRIFIEQSANFRTEGLIRERIESEPSSKIDDSALNRKQDSKETVTGKETTRSSHRRRQARVYFPV